MGVFTMATHFLFYCPATHATLPDRPAPYAPAMNVIRAWRALRSLVSSSVPTGPLRYTASGGTDPGLAEQDAVGVLEDDAVSRALRRVRDDGKTTALRPRFVLARRTTRRATSCASWYSEGRRRRRRACM